MERSFQYCSGAHPCRNGPDAGRVRVEHAHSSTSTVCAPASSGRQFSVGTRPAKRIAFRGRYACASVTGVTPRAQTAPVPADELGEKEFYLDEFHSHTLCFAVALRDCEQPGGFEAVGNVLRELIANETRVIVLLGVPEGERDVRSALGRVRRRL